MRGAAIAVLVGGLCLASCQPAPRAPASRIVVIDKMAYGPAPSSLRVGDTLVWVNHDILRHTATARDRSFDVDLPPGASRSVVLNRAGAIDVHCRYHPDMKLRLMVEPKT